jgi:hypothetical protein
MLYSLGQDVEHKVSIKKGITTNLYRPCAEIDPGDPVDRPPDLYDLYDLYDPSRDLSMLEVLLVVQPSILSLRPQTWRGCNSILSNLWACRIYSGLS